MFNFKHFKMDLNFKEIVKVDLYFQKDRVTEDR